MGTVESLYEDVFVWTCPICDGDLYEIQPLEFKSKGGGLVKFVCGQEGCRYAIQGIVSELKVCQPDEKK